MPVRWLQSNQMEAVVNEMWALRVMTEAVAAETVSIGGAVAGAVVE